LTYPIADAFPQNARASTRDPVEAIHVQTVVRALLIAASYALRLQVSFGSGRLVNCPNTNGIAHVCVGPRSCTIPKARFPIASWGIRDIIAPDGD
jgi:hypothetical protein